MNCAHARAAQCRGNEEADIGMLHFEVEQMVAAASLGVEHASREVSDRSLYYDKTS